MTLFVGALSLESHWLFGLENRAVAATRNTLPQLMLTISKTPRGLEADRHLQNESIEDTDSSEDEVKPRGRQGREATGKGAYQRSG